MIFLQSLIVGLLTVGMLLASAVAEELLPAGVVNVVLPDFGDDCLQGGDCGLANAEPVEVGPGVGREREIRIVRTPQQELPLSEGSEARFQVRLGEVDYVYFWLEAPPVYGQWHASVSVVYPDGNVDTIFGADLLPDGVNAVWVPPRALLEVRVTSKDRAMKLSKQFTFTVSPVLFSRWPNFSPIPYKTLWGHVGP